MATPWPIYASQPVRVADTFEGVRLALRELPDLARSLGPLAGFVSYDASPAFDAVPAHPDRDAGLPLLWFGRVEPLPTHQLSAARPTTARPLITRGDYERDVSRCLDYIAAGDVFQINYAQSFRGPADAPGDVYARLNARSPAPFAAWLDLGAASIVSHSPELFFSVDKSRRIVNRPIKGTRPNLPGMAEELRRSAKDAAELAMIVDLQRNDLGRVCEIGTVKVVEPRRIETLPTVVHAVATITGELRRDVTLDDVFAALFPCGSITGCPKIRAMQLIGDFEPVARGPYCGAIGVIEPDGSCAFNVAIRTMVITAAGARVSVGGGIVADSTPAAEYDETLTKAAAMFAALGWRLD